MEVAVLCDNQSALHSAKNLVFHARTKNTDVEYHFVHNLVEDGKIFLGSVWFAKLKFEYKIGKPIPILAELELNRITTVVVWMKHKI